MRCDSVLFGHACCLLSLHSPEMNAFKSERIDRDQLIAVSLFNSLFVLIILVSSSHISVIMGKVITEWAYIRLGHVVIETIMIWLNEIFCFSCWCVIQFWNSCMLICESEWEITWVSILELIKIYLYFHSKISSASNWEIIWAPIPELIKIYLYFHFKISFASIILYCHYFVIFDVIFEI